MRLGKQAAVWAAAAVLGSAATAARAADKAPLSAEKMWSLKRLGNPAISPDGKWSVLPVTSYDVAQDKGLTDLWLVPSDGGAARPLTTHESSESNPAWSPDGQWVAFEAKRGDDENPQIYVIAAAGGEARRVTKVPTGALAAKWFPDSRRLCFLSRVWTDLKSWDEMAKRQKERKDSKMSARTFDRAPIRYWDTWLDDRQTHVYTTSVDGGEPVAVTAGTGRQLTAGGAGSRLVRRVSRRSGDRVRGGRGHLGAGRPTSTSSSSRAAGGPARNVSADNPASDNSPLYSPDGRWLAFGRQAIKGFYGDTVRLVLHDRKAGREPGGRGAVGPVGDGPGLAARQPRPLRRHRRRGRVAGLLAGGGGRHPAGGDPGEELLGAEPLPGRAHAGGPRGAPSPSRRRWSASTWRPGRPRSCRTSTTRRSWGWTGGPTRA